MKINRNKFPDNPGPGRLARLFRALVITTLTVLLILAEPLIKGQSIPAKMTQSIALDATYRIPGKPPVAIDTVMWFRNGAVDIGLMMRNLFPGNCNSKYYIEFHVPKGRTMSFRLPDGSSVHLNADSRLVVRCDFAQHIREVALVGEGFFDVTTDANKQFIVHSLKMDVLVLGTSFNINNYPDNHFSQLAVLSGKVLLMSRENKSAASPESTVLSAGNCVTIKRQTGDMDTAAFNQEEIMGWRHGHFICNNKKLDEIGRLIGRVYNKRIAIDNQEKIKNKISGTFYLNRDITYFLKDLRENNPSVYFYRDAQGIFHLGQKDD